jgi:aminoglycoside 6'-N-acetyltransferase I
MTRATVYGRAKKSVAKNGFPAGDWKERTDPETEKIQLPACPACPTDYNNCMITFKVLGPKDGGVLAKVAPDVFDDPIDVGRANEFLADPRHHLVVAVDRGQVVGFVSAVSYLHPDKPRPELWINEIGVAASHRRRGLGKGLLRSLLAVAQGMGCAEAWVLTDRTNTAAMRLYSAIGSTEPTDHVMFTFRLDEGTSEPAGGDAAATDAQTSATDDPASNGEP